MSLTFIYGNSGSGKSEYIVQKIVEEAARAPYRRFYVVVPEQFTMRTQKSLVEHTKSGVIMNIDVVSFERLAYRVFDELGVHHAVMEETGKSLVLRRIVEEKESELTVLRGSLKKMGYIGELKSMISELMQYDISPERLEDFLAQMTGAGSITHSGVAGNLDAERKDSNSLKEGSALSLKLKDILCIYRAFDEYLQDDYVTAERVLEVLLECAADSALLRGATFVFDGYTGFTPVQMKLLHQLLALAKDVYVTVTMDAREGIYDMAGMQELFYMSHKMVRALTESAREAHVEIAEPVCIANNEKSRFANNPVLAHLERNLFRARPEVYTSACDGRLHITSLANPKAELTYAASKICELVRQGYRYRDFAIVSSNVEGYANYAAYIFARYEIPYFLDVKQSVLYHPFTELLRALLEILEHDFPEESVFRYLRTGLCGFTAEEIDFLENYCLEKGIHGAAKWKKRFARPFRQHGRIKADEEKRKAELLRLNALRKRFWEQVSGVYEVFGNHGMPGRTKTTERQKKVNANAETIMQEQTQSDERQEWQEKTSVNHGATVRKQTLALYQFLRHLKIEEQLREKQKEFADAGQEQLAEEYRQIYKIVIDLLDKMVDLLGDEMLSISDYSDILEAGFASAKVGTIPQGNDCLIVGDIERTRLEGVKILFFLGVNDGLIPKAAGRGGILSQYDRDVMEANRLELAPGAREQVFLQRFYLYWNLTKPSEALYLTYARMDGEGKAARPSYLIGVLQKLFEKLPVEEIAPEEPVPAVTLKSGVDAYLAGLSLAKKGDVRPEWKALHKWFGARMDWATVIAHYFQAGFSPAESSSLTADLARLLYGTVLTNSVTRLELFAKCAFAHFLEYGLKLSERNTFSFESVDMGSMFHEILHGYCTRLEAESDWETVTPAQQETFLKAAMEEAVLKMPNESLLESERGAYVLERIYRIMWRSVWALTEQIRRGDFRPEGYEVEFSQVSKLSVDTLMRTDRGTMEFSDQPGETEALMRTVGRVDRVDTYENNGRIFVKVVDYKSGNTKFQLLQLYYGMQLQLVVYLNAATEQLKKAHPDKEIVPAGIFYCHLDDPLVESDGAADEAEILNDVLKELKLNGLVSLEPDAYTHMDRELLVKGKSDIIPIALNKDLTVSRRGTSAATTEDFEKLSAHVNEKIKASADAILGGEIGVRPMRLGDRTGCDYCAYKSVCGFDARIPGYGFTNLEQMKDEEIWAKVHAKLEKR